MKGSLKIISLMAVISLLLGVIWLPLSFAATVPSFASLGILGAKGQDYGSPMGIAMDAAGNFYIADGSGTLSPVTPPQDKIVKLDTYGNKVAEFDSLELSGPIAVKSDGSEIYVAIGQSFSGHGKPGVDGVLVYDGVTGALKRSIGTNNGPDGRGEFRKVTDLKLDSNGWLYIADSGVVKVYDAGGVFQFDIGAPCAAGSSTACEAGEFLSITSIALDEASGEFFAADRGTRAYSPENTAGSESGNIQVFDLATRAYKRVMLQAQMGGPITTALPFEEYYGLVADGQGRFYVVRGQNQKGVLRAMDTSIAYPANAFLAGCELGGTTYRSVYDSANSRLIFAGEQGLVIVGIDGGSNPVAPVNQAPSVPAMGFPSADDIVQTAAPTLNFSAATDPDGDSVSYQIRLAQAGQPYGAPVDVTTNSYTAGGLVENAHYVWQVQAVDSKGAVSGWSTEGTFWVNAVNEAPSVPQLVSPLNGEFVWPWDALFWKVSNDPDPANKIRYRLTLSRSPDFSGPLLSETRLVRWGVFAQLQTLKNYMRIVAGVPYFWRLEANDYKGGWSKPSTAGSFILRATDLRVDTNVPGVKVYLAGNSVVRGQYLGATPLTVRNPAVVGWNDLVLERPGFEPVVRPIFIQKFSSKKQYFQLVPALGPVVGPVVAHRIFYWGNDPATGQGRTYYLGSDVREIRSVFVGNIDRVGGRLDVVVARNDGSVEYYPTLRVVGSQGKFQVATPRKLLPAGSATSLFMIDWNNNGNVDLLVGGSDGRLRVYYNELRRQTPIFKSVPEVLKANGQDLIFASNLVPVVIDWDNDGLNDILVGDDSGKLSFVKNIGTVKNPVFTDPVVVFQSQDPVAPCLVDWDGDGDKEILLTDKKGVSLYEIQNGGLVYAETIPLKYKDGRLFSAQINTRVFALDLDGAGGKDLIIVDGSGRFMVASSNGTKHVASFKPALLTKTDQVQTLVDAQSPAQANQVGAVRAAIQSAQNDDYAAASLEVDNLLAGLDPAGSAYAAASELKQLLQ
ncbi:FG-GAP-like repeat-containing protein [Geothermobacter hydrogeniphilus]|uniref:Fibronectin type-III domain-containing protein n=1 Tax=Geothermobacter hydrogeniphilus TaxID=1969733 RepID=A0A1X0Y5F5_9BACT|nr:FG-GAP-like repeat-containing protein [Geothermobacter hydrogeniphilus]ORJ60338.1 hypothetical protein B5V00_08800 [Geothermobacter hydrogeniphilus]